MPSAWKSSRARRILPIVAVLVLAGTAPASAGVCVQAPSIRAFLPWGDYDYYSLVPGGNFAGALTWTKTGAPVLYAQNNPFNLSGAGTTSVRLRKAEAITSPAVCVDAAHPHLRFVARALDSTSRLVTEALWLDRGVWRTTVLGEQPASAHRNWAPSRIVGLGSLLPTSDGRSYQVKLRFRLRDNVGDWLVDDVFVDPAARR